jgi:hypothetical protein
MMRVLCRFSKVKVSNNIYINAIVEKINFAAAKIIGKCGLIKLFSSSLTFWTNKLECLSLEIIFSLVQFFVDKARNLLLKVFKAGGLHSYWEILD